MIKTTTKTAEQERKEIENGYSYFRLSSRKQLAEDRTGIARQLSRPQEICDSHKWKLQKDSFADWGVSSFHDKNRMRGNLSRFIALAKDNKLQPNSVLILEAWDRYSRGTIDEAFESVRELLLAGVAFHIAYGDRTFTTADLQNADTRNEITQSLHAAHNYSKQLSQRVTSAKSKKLQRLANGESVNLRDFAPRWIGWNEETRTMFLNDRSKSVEIIFREYQSGKSLASICRVLHSENIPSCLNGHWTRGTVAKILRNPATFGEFHGKANVFPAVVTKEQFQAVETMLSHNSGVRLAKDEKAEEGTSFGRRGRNAKSINIFRGLVHCSTCGHSMSLNTSRSKRYYRCHYHIDGSCQNGFSVNASEIEENIICGLLQCSPEDLLASHDKSLSFQIANLNTQREALIKRIDALLDLAGIVEIKSKVAPLVEERNAVDAQISKFQLQSRAASGSPESLSAIKALMLGKDQTLGIEDSIDKALEIVSSQLANEETRSKLAVIMPQVIKSIVLECNSKLTVNYVTGGSDTDLLF